MTDMEPTEQAELQLRGVIATAWTTNADTVWPAEADGPDVRAMAEIAARSAWAYFLNIIDAARSRGAGEGGC